MTTGTKNVVESGSGDANHAADRVQIAELNRLYEIGLSLLERTQEPSALQDSLLTEYIARLSELPGVNIQEALDDPLHPELREKTRALTMYARLAELIQENADFQQQLKDRNAELAALNANYLNLMGFVSHELRGPLVSILGFAELLNDGFLGKLSADQNRSIGIIKNVARDLIDMTENYLDLARIENGELVINWQEFDFESSLLQPLADTFSGAMAHRGMQLVRTHGPLDKLPVQGDPELLRIVVSNLLGNAIKYGTEKTAIELGARVIENSLHVSIRNQGSGVPAGEAEHVFEKYRHAQPEDGQKAAGTGLGLFNTRCIVEAHGGTIQAESRQGEWFQISFDLPCRRHSEATRVHLPISAPISTTT